MPIKNLENPIRYKTFNAADLSLEMVRDKSVTDKTKLVTLYETAPKIADNVYRFIGTSESIDRDGEIVLVDAWDFTNYKGNPIVLWAHEHDDLPVGKTVGLYKDIKKKVIYFDIEFTDSYDFAKSVRELVEEGILRATSVGFRVLDWEYDEKNGAFVFTKTELFEISIVNVPANQDALIQEGKELDTLETKAVKSDELANVITQIQERLESLTLSVETLITQNSAGAPDGDAGGEGDDGAEPEPALETLEDDKSKDEGNPDVPKTPDISTNAEMVAAITAAVLAQLQQEKDDSEDDPEEQSAAEPPSGEADEDDSEGESEDEDSKGLEPDEEDSEEEPTPDEPDEFVSVNVDEIDEAEGFIIITEEEN